MTIDEMCTLIEKRRMKDGSIQKYIEKNYFTFHDKVIASVYYLSSQSYGLFIKKLIKENFRASSKENENGSYKVKVFVGDNNKKLVLKQVTPNEDVDSYILVFINYAASTVEKYRLPASFIWSNLSKRPDHGTRAKGITEEYSSHLFLDQIKEYIIAD